MSAMLNFLVCLAPPLIIAMLLLQGEAKRFMAFMLAGLVICLLATTINSFLASMANFDTTTAAIKLTPICEEILKAFPVLFFVLVYSPAKKDIVTAALAVGLGFTMLENCGFLAQYESIGLAFAALRGFSAGVLHAVCATLLGYGLAFVQERKYLALPGALALLCTSTTLHAIYNLLVLASGAWRTVGMMIPLVTTGVLLAVLGGRLHGTEHA